MPTQKKVYPFLPLFERFLKDSKSGRRLQPNGKRIAPGTLENYRCTKNLLEQFCLLKNFELRLRPEKSLTKDKAGVERAYWKRFYRLFTDYLYDDLGHFDNYVGATVKNIKTFFNYCNRDLTLGVGSFHRQFYVRKEDIAIHPLLPEELNYLIYDEVLEQKLSRRLKEAKDVFVFGCTVALRVSDLLSVKRAALRVVNGQTYLAVVTPLLVFHRALCNGCTTNCKAIWKRRPLRDC